MTHKPPIWKMNVQTPIVSMGICAPGGVQSMLNQNRTLLAIQPPSGNSIVLFTAPRTPKERLASKAHPGGYPQDLSLQVYQWYSISDDRIAFFNRTHALFVTLQQICSENKGVVDSQVNVKLDHIIQLCAEVRELIDITLIAVKKKNSEDVVIFETLRSVWQLCDIFYFNPVEGPIGEELLLWITQNEPLAPGRVHSIAQKPFERHLHPDFWPVLFSYILRAQFKHVISMLRDIPMDTDLMNTEDNVINILIDFMKTMPRIRFYESKLVFLEEFATWRENLQCYVSESQLQQMLDNEEYVEKFLLVFRTLYGDEETILNLSESWFEAIVALTVYSHPATTRTEVGGLLSEIQNKINNGTAYECVIESILKLDIISAIPHCLKIDGWLVAHLTDFLDKLSKFDELKSSTLLNSEMERMLTLKSEMNISMRDWFLINYANTCLGNGELWVVGLDYLTFCGSAARATMEEAVLRIPPDSDFRIKKLLEYCSNNKLVEQANIIHKVIAKSQYASGNLGDAIYHYLSAGEHKRTARIIDKLIDGLLETGDIDTVDSLVRSLPGDVSDERLFFLYRYCEFHKEYRQKQYVKAGNLLISLLNSGHAPKRMWPNLLLDAIPLLQSKVLIFNVEDTYELMRCLEEVVFKKLDIGQPDTFVISVRSALTKNLARAIIAPI
ncbi:Nucleoporin nup85 [Nowakowskiella sp. JEL0078]|nr:Nucleoporin nup85 [Nowakowskiella sp. JEL0078]